MQQGFQRVITLSRSFAMMKTIRSQVVLAVVVSLASAVGFAQAAGEATYKAKCQACHGATGTPSAGMVKAMAVKPVSDPEAKKFSDLWALPRRRVKRPTKPSVKHAMARPVLRVPEW